LKPESGKVPDDQTIRIPAAARRVQGIRLVGPGGPVRLGLGTFKVGRAVDADVRLEDRQVSRAHATLVVDDTSATIEDLKTVNGTLVNGQEVKGREPIKSGDTVRFGDSEFTVELIT
jgi:pSer/pThr/pTyr-binding forkhead associated (FHA) protein